MLLLIVDYFFTVQFWFYDVRCLLSFHLRLVQILAERKYFNRISLNISKPHESMYYLQETHLHDYFSKNPCAFAFHWNKTPSPKKLSINVFNIFSLHFVFKEFPLHARSKLRTTDEEPFRQYCFISKTQNMFILKAAYGGCVVFNPVTQPK